MQQLMNCECQIQVLPWTQSKMVPPYPHHMLQFNYLFSSYMASESEFFFTSDREYWLKTLCNAQISEKKWRCNNPIAQNYLVIIHSSACHREYFFMTLLRNISEIQVSVFVTKVLFLNKINITTIRLFRCNFSRNNNVFLQLYSENHS